MSRIIKLAMSETKNAFQDMPSSLDELDALEPHLEALRQANLQHHLDLMKAAANAGVQVIGLGELFTAPYFATTRHPMWRRLAEDALEGPTVTQLREAARAHGLAVIAPIYERVPNTEARYNTAVVIDGDGEVRGRYRKTHIPQGDNEQGSFFERFYYGAADATTPEALYPVFDLGFAKIGVAICYDRHFEGVMRSLKAHGAELVFSPAVTFGQKSERMWELEFEVDAARHGMFIAGSNRLGVEPPFDVRYFGRSYIAGPDGRAELDRSAAGLVIGEVDLEALSRPDPSGWKLGRDRRAGQYED